MLITNARLITWGEPNQILEDQAVLIGEGKVVEFGPSTELIKRHPEQDWLDARGQIVGGDLLLFRRRGLISIAGRGIHSHAAKAACRN
jgi:cytosine/adenosine deaminase-related metal-dependent hydrolase